MKNKKPCLCCEKQIPAKQPKICPECGHVFQGNGWEGIDAHWRANHENVMTYEDFWTSLCDEHKSTHEMINYHADIDILYCPHVAIDLGYSHYTPSCGIMHPGIKEPAALKFGATIKEVAGLVEEIGKCVLILEAVLSTYHDKHGNPDIRGDFEKGRGWYYGPGVVTYAAANRFLRILRQHCSSNTTVYLAEAFLSFKKKRSRHSDDALIIFDSFWETKSESLKDGTEPILDFIEGTPSVRVFKLKDS